MNIELNNLKVGVLKNCLKNFSINEMINIILLSIKNINNYGGLSAFTTNDFFK